MQSNPTLQKQATDSSVVSTSAQIKLKEKEAEIAILEARENAEKLISSARVKAEEIIRSARELPNDVIESALNNAKQTVATIQENAKETLKKEGDFFDSKITHNTIDKTVDAVIELLLKKILQ